MQTLKCVVTVMLGLSAMSCGTDGAAGLDAQRVDASALTLPFPDQYFDMFMGRDAAAVAEQPEGCAPLLEQVATAWEGIQSTPQFKQVADTPAWQAAEEARTSYAGSGCFTSGTSLSAPVAECKPDFGKLVAAWHAVERTPQFNVLISGVANHDLYASWLAAVASRCVMSS